MPVSLLTHKCVNITNTTKGWSTVVGLGPGHTPCVPACVTPSLSPLCCVVLCCVWWCVWEVGGKGGWLAVASIMFMPEIILMSWCSICCNGELLPNGRDNLVMRCNDYRAWSTRKLRKDTSLLG